VIEVRRAADRFETIQAGISTRHCFSSGAHYDPANVAFGPLLAADEHVVAPGAGFSRHAHRGIDIVSWVLSGTLRHEGASGPAVLVTPGTALYQSAGSGIEHSEANASAEEPLRFIQLWLLADVSTPQCRLAEPPLSMASGSVAVITPSAPTELAAADYVHLLVTSGSVAAGGQGLHAGDSVRVRDEPLVVQGDGDALVWRCRPAALLSVLQQRGRLE
jgi:quercetin 2,3-dioxygenase